MENELALFDTVADCWQCGRPLRNGVCGWCSQNGTAKSLPPVRNGSPRVQSLPDMRHIRDTRDEAIRRVNANAEPDWKTLAVEIGHELARSRFNFTSEDISDRIPAHITTHEPRAMGAVMTRLRKAKVISPTDEFVMARSRVGHGRPSRVWESLIYRIEGETK